MGLYNLDPFTCTLLVVLYVLTVGLTVLFKAKDQNIMNMTPQLASATNRPQQLLLITKSPITSVKSSEWMFFQFFVFLEQSNCLILKKALSVLYILRIPSVRHIVCPVSGSRYTQRQQWNMHCTVVLCFVVFAALCPQQSDGSYTLPPSGAEAALHFAGVLGPCDCYCPLLRCPSRNTVCCSFTRQEGLL